MSFGIEEDRYAEEEAQAGGDHREAAVGRCTGLASVQISQGASMADAIRQMGLSEVTLYRWRQAFGGLKTDQVKL
jgi:hypothetical protein